jgi:hypothetical protein
MNTTQQILSIVQAFNQSWMAGEFDRLGQYLHPNVVFANMAAADRVRGQENCLAAFSDLRTHTRTQAYDVRNEKVEVWGKTAVASYEFIMNYQMAGRDFQKTGRDILVFNLDQGDWKVVYRTVSPL